MLRVVLNLEVETDLDSVHSMIDHINFNSLTESGDDVVEVTSVEVEDFAAF